MSIERAFALILARDQWSQEWYCLMGETDVMFQYFHGSHKIVCLGGNAKDDETSMDTIRREISEETLDLLKPTMYSEIFRIYTNLQKHAFVPFIPKVKKRDPYLPMFETNETCHDDVIFVMQTTFDISLPSRFSFSRNIISGIGRYLRNRPLTDDEYTTLSSEDDEVTQLLDTHPAFRRTSKRRQRRRPSQKGRRRVIHSVSSDYTELYRLRWWKLSDIPRLIQQGGVWVPEDTSVKTMTETGFAVLCNVHAVMEFIYKSKN